MRTLHFAGLLGLATLTSGAAWAKLPAPSDEAKAKAAEAAAKTAHGNAVGNFQLCKSMDRVAAVYRDAARKSGQEVKPATDTPACADPGAFTYTPPSAKPAIEAAGAHSPAKTATAPPSSTTPQSAMPAKK